MMSRSVRKEKDIVQVQEEVQEEADETHNDAIPVDKLQASGINAGDINKLKAAGLYTIMGVLMRPKKDLTQIKGLSEAKIEKIVEACNKHVSIFSFMTGADYAMKRQKVVRFSTGCKSVDELLGGGVESQSITEIYGEFRSGKTQLCHMLCVTCQLPYDQGGVSGKAVYIDSEGTFRPERIMKIAERYGMDPETAMENILFARAYTHEHQDALITLAAAKMCEEKFGVLIVDSITSLFRVDFSGRGELAARQQALAQTLSKLIKVASEFNVAVVMTNQVMADPGGGMTFVQDVKKPIGGHVLAHASTTRLYVRKGKGDQRCLKVVDSPMLAEAETTFRITENGIEEGDGDVA